MPYCNSCGGKLSEGSVFCSNCGESIQNKSQLKGQETFIGLYKKLDTNEHITVETKLVTPVIFVKEIESTRLGMHGRQEIPIALCQANVYLTDKRLLFLVLYSLDAQTVANIRKTKTSRLSGVSGTWFDLPLSAIEQVEMRPLKLLRGKHMDNFFKNIIEDKGEREKFLQQPAVEIIYDEQITTGRIKDYMQSLFKMGFFSRLTTKLEKSFDKLLIAGEEIVSIIPSLKTSKSR